MIKRKTSKKKVVFSTIFQQTNNQHKTISHTTTMIIKRRIKSMTKSENRKDITKFLLTAQRIRIIKIYNQTNKIGNIFLFVVKTIFIVFVVSNSFASQIFHRLVKTTFRIEAHNRKFQPKPSASYWNVSKIIIIFAVFKKKEQVLIIISNFFLPSHSRKQVNFYPPQQRRYC